MLANQRWAIACSSITAALTFLMVVAMTHDISSSIVTGTKVEGGLLVVLTGFWAGTVSIVSDARNGLAVNASGSVESGNLYYFSWAGFVCSVMLVVSYLRGVFNVDVTSELRNRSARLTTWSALLAAQLIGEFVLACVHICACLCACYPLSVSLSVCLSIHLHTSLTRVFTHTLYICLLFLAHTHNISHGSISQLVRCQLCSPPGRHDIWLL